MAGMLREHPLAPGYQGARPLWVYSHHSICLVRPTLWWSPPARCHHGHRLLQLGVGLGGTGASCSRRRLPLARLQPRQPLPQRVVISWVLAKASLQGVRRGPQTDLEPPGTAQSLFLEGAQQEEGSCGCSALAESIRLMNEASSCQDSRSC